MNLEASRYLLPRSQDPIWSNELFLFIYLSFSLLRYVVASHTRLVKYHAITAAEKKKIQIKNLKSEVSFSS